MAISRKLLYNDTLSQYFTTLQVVKIGQDALKMMRNVVPEQDYFLEIVLSCQVRHTSVRGMELPATKTFISQICP